MAKGYTDEAHISAYLNLAMTEDQKTEMNYLLDFVETYIDRKTLRSWFPTTTTTTTITGELQPLRWPVIWTKYHPVTSITQIQTRSSEVGDTWVTLTAGTDYELWDANKGEVHFVGGYSGPRAYASVTYVPNLPVPADITRCATLIVAHSMFPHIYSDRIGISQAQAAQGVAVTYEDDTLTLQVPDLAMQIINCYRTGRTIIA